MQSYFDSMMAFCKTHTTNAINASKSAFQGWNMNSKNKSNEAFQIQASEKPKQMEKEVKYGDAIDLSDKDVKEISESQIYKKLQQIIKQVISSSKQKVFQFCQVQSYRVYLKKIASLIKQNKKIQSSLKGLAVGSQLKMAYLLLLKYFGFGKLGITFGSWASIIQSKFLGGYIVKNGLFALLQSAGATAVLFSPISFILLLISVSLLFLSWFCQNQKKKGGQNNSQTAHSQANNDAINKSGSQKNSQTDKKAGNQDNNNNIQFLPLWNKLLNFKNDIFQKITTSKPKL